MISFVSLCPRISDVFAYPSIELTLALAASWIFIAVLYFFWWLQHPLHGKNPGGPVYPIFGSLFSIMKNKSRIYDWITETLQNSPSLTIRNVLFGIEMFTTANPANIEHILKSNFHNYPKGYRFIMIMEDMLGRGIFNADGELWKSQRKAASYEFTSHTLRSLIFESVQVEITSRLLPVLIAARDKGNLVDLQDLFLRFAFDNVCQISLGVDPNCLNPSLTIVPFAKAFDDATELSSQRFLTASWFWKFKRALNLGSEKRMREAVHVVHAFATDVIHKRRKEHLAMTTNQTNCRRDLLFRFLCLVEMEKTKSMAGDPENCMDRQADKNAKTEAESDELLRDIIISFLLAGRDTSSTGLSWLFWLLSLNPDVETAIYEEIHGVVQSRREEVANEGDQRVPQQQVFSFEELKKMQLLHAAIHEALRLYPPVPQDTKLALQKDVLPDGTVVRKGSQVNYHPYAMGRIESIWGADCLMFKPERWLDCQGNFVQENPFKFPIFQAGPRVCLGKEMAIIQMKSVAAALIHEFTFEVPEGYEPPYALSLTMKMKEGLPVFVRSR